MRCFWVRHKLMKLVRRRKKDWVFVYMLDETVRNSIVMVNECNSISGKE